MGTALKRLHRWLGLGAALIWLIQVVSGVLLTFRQEIDAALVAVTTHATAVSSAPADIDAIAARIDSIHAGGGQVRSLWVTNFSATRFDLNYRDSGHADRTMRIDSAGAVLRDESPGPLGGFFPALTDIHTTLLAGETGKWVITVSGILLLSNLLVGLKLAWPRRGSWKQALSFRPKGIPMARMYGLHRALGLWVAVPLIVVFSAGIGLCFEDGLESALGVEQPAPTNAPEGTGFTAAQAMKLALDRYPNSTLTALYMPKEGRAWYRIYVHAPGEVSRMYGQTDIYISTANGAVLQEYPAVGESTRRFLYGLIYPVHTAEAGGVIARAILLMLGLALLTMGTFGIRLWLMRRSRRVNSSR